MLTCEVLVSSMNRTKKELKKLIEDMKIKSDAIIINQIPEKKISFTNEICDNKHIISVKEKGLSKSRNLAIMNAKNDICIIADDDLVYEDNYQELILDQYKLHPDADIIAFVVDNEDENRKKRILKEGRVGYIKSMKLQSVQITFKRKSILDFNINFDENFGIGAKYYWGEENIFLFDCLRKKLKIYYVPIKIGTLKLEESMWNKDNTPNHYMIQGAIYYRMSKFLYPLLILQFGLRKKKIYSMDMTTFEVIKYMIQGAIEYKRKN